LLKERPKLIYAVPNFQNPGGTCLSLERRFELARLLGRQEIGLVEDDPYGQLRYEGEPLPPVFSLSPGTSVNGGWNEHVIFVSTFSKVLAPGLRVGWVIAPEQVIEKLIHAKQAADLHTSTYNQYLALELVRDGFLDRHVPALCNCYRQRRDAMLAALERWFPEEANWTRPLGGFFLMVTLPEGLDASLLLPRSLERRVAFVPGAEFHLDGQGASTLRLNFSCTTPELIEKGVKRLGNLLKQVLVENGQRCSVAASERGPLCDERPRLVARASPPASSGGVTPPGVPRSSSERGLPSPQAR
jgi:2-aminoadipate transaminase